MLVARTIVADSPWLFGDPLGARGAQANYRCMTVDELVAFPSTWEFLVADDAYLLFWRVAAMQEEALSVVRAWGFRVSTELVWLKRTRLGKRWFGMGRTLRAEHEVCLVAARGRPSPLKRNTRTTFAAPCLGHSRKPDEFYELVEGTFPEPRVELFARRRRPEWFQFGDQLPVPPPAVRDAACL